MLHKSCKSQFINRSIFPDASLKMSPFKWLNAEIYCFITAVTQRTIIWFNYMILSETRKPAPASRCDIKDILKSETQGQQVVPYSANFRTSAQNRHADAGC